MKIKNSKCPDCGSMATYKLGLGGLGVSLLLTTSVLMWIPIIGWIGIPFTLIGSLICFAIAPFSKTTRVRCRSCKYQWNESKKQTDIADVGAIEVTIEKPSKIDELTDEEIEMLLHKLKEKRDREEA